MVLIGNTCFLPFLEAVFSWAAYFASKDTSESRNPLEQNILSWQENLEQRSRLEQCFYEDVTFYFGASARTLAFLLLRAMPHQLASLSAFNVFLMESSFPPKLWLAF